MKKKFLPHWHSGRIMMSSLRTMTVTAAWPVGPGPPGRPGPDAGPAARNRDTPTGSLAGWHLVIGSLSLSSESGCSDSESGQTSIELVSDSRGGSLAVSWESPSPAPGPSQVPVPPWQLARACGRNT